MVTAKQEQALGAVMQALTQAQLKALRTALEAEQAVTQTVSRERLTEIVRKIAREN